MYNIFDSAYPISPRVTTQHEFMLIDRFYTVDLDRIIDYYRTRKKDVRNTHPLVRALKAHAPNTGLPWEDYMRYAYVKADIMARTMGMSSENRPGVFYHDLFYRGPGIMIGVNDYVPLSEASNWKNLVSVKPLTHPVSTLEMMIPNPDRYYTPQEGLSVVQVHIPKLLMQYKAWANEQLKLPEGERQDISVFVAQYVLPNMMYQHLDLALYNRFKDLYRGKKIPDDHTERHAIYLVDYTRKVDLSYERIIKRIIKTPLMAEEYLFNIPTVTNPTAFETLKMPEMARTRQVWWSLFLARMDDMLFLLELMGERGRRRNREHISRLNIMAKRLIRDHVYDNLLDPELRDEIELLLFTFMNYKA